jgi:hypothetical protein
LTECSDAKPDPREYAETAVSLKDLGGVFSRYFLAGFFVPALSTLIIGILVDDSSFFPPLADNASLLSRLGVLIGIAVVTGLILLGLRRAIIRLYEGYPLEHAVRRYTTRPSLPIPRLVRPSWWGYQTWSILRWRQQRLFERMRGDRSEAGRRAFDRAFPTRSTSLLPTRFGNALRAFEYHSDVRWGLSGLAAWPRIASLLSDRERELHVDVETDLMFALNASVGSAVLAVVIAAHQWGHGSSPAELWLSAGALAASYAFYRLAIVAAISWGVEVRSSVDLHRLELYERLGVRRPKSFTDERRVASRVSRLIDFGDWLADGDWGPESWND